MKLSEMRRVLEDKGIQLTKSLGQNFLHDGNQLDRIAVAAELQPTDRILEIGPGLGPLTERLLECSVKVLAVEKDERLVQVLRERFATQLANGGQLELLHDDALAFLKTTDRDWSEWKLVSNLPYSVASPLLVELAQGSRGPTRMVATLQLEVVRRLAATPQDEDYGLLTLLVQLNYEPVSWFKVPRGSFFPEPEVDSGCITLVRRPAPVLPYELHACFVRVVKRAFSQRRKMMLKLLKQDWPAEKLTRVLEGNGISLQTRAEALSLDQFAAIVRGLQSSPAPA